ncbi:hypothetical protein NDA01_21505 [Trichocoleus desertorum AS-A10]|uniref:hypothetical protein n=1 Tax=Trichocoleus desertorum TaxID=1481672 RepID=UPI003297234D
MSDFYEFALLFTVKPDVPQEVVGTLQYMVQGQGFDFTPTLSNPLFSEPGGTVIHPSGTPIRVLPAWHSFFRDGHSELEEYLTGSFGNSFSENRLAVRQVIHEDAFFNTWDELGEWLASISATVGLVGYYRNLEDDSIEDANFICFESGQLSEPSIEDVQNVDAFLQDLENALSASDT